MLQVEQPKPTLCHHHGFAECAVPSPTSHTYLEGPLQLLSFALAALARSVGKKKKRLRPRNRPQPLRMGTGTGHHWGLQQWGHPTSPSPGRGQAGGGPDAVVQKNQLSSSATGPGLILGTREQGTRDRGATRLISAAPGASPVLPGGMGASGAGWEPHTTSALPCGWGWDVGASGKEPLTLPGVRVSPGCGGDR